MASIGSTEFLTLIAKDNLTIVVERAEPRGKLKRDIATLRDAMGHHVGIQSGSFKSSLIELPIDTLNDYLKARLVEIAGHDTEGNEVYVITDDGRRQVGS